MPLLDLLGPSYRDENPAISRAETINWMPERVEEAKGRFRYVFRTPPGLLQFVNTAQGSIRGFHRAPFTLIGYSVNGTQLCRINADGTSTALGTIAGSGFVGMASDDLILIIVSGQGNPGYVYTFATSTLTTISDADFTGSNTVVYFHEAFYFDGDGQRLYRSENGLAFAGAEEDFAILEPDEIKAVFVDHDELMLWGSHSCEFWRYSGDGVFPVERVNGVVIEKGLAHAWAICKADNNIYWLGDDGVVYRLNGRSPERVSTIPIDTDVQSASFSTALMWSYNDRGHWFVYLQLPNRNGFRYRTYCFDGQTQEWHRRNTYQQEGWRAQFHIYIHDKHLVGDFGSGIIWELKHGVYVDGDQPLVSERYTTELHADGLAVFWDELELLWDTGRGLVTGQGSAPLVNLRYSDDGGRNWSNTKTRSLGAIGKYTERVLFLQLGRSRRRIFHIWVSDPIKRDWMGARARTRTALA